jgi:nucleoside-diphosphate-sugar epimerase
MKILSILGAGWLGLELAHTLKDHYTIKLAARNEEAQRIHIDLGFKSYVLTEGVYDNLDVLLSCEYLFINYPPSKFKDYLHFIKRLSQHPAFSTVEKIFFVSSSSIYPKMPGVYNENCEISSSSNPLYYEAEKSLHGNAQVIFRCAGLMGAGRIAGKYYSNKPVKDGKSRVNHVHQMDVIRAVIFAIDHHLEGIFNLSAPLHPTKEELYRYQCAQCQLIFPLFIESVESKQRIIEGRKLEDLGFEYLHKNPMEFID